MISIVRKLVYQIYGLLHIFDQINQNLTLKVVAKLGLQAKSSNDNVS